MTSTVAPPVEPPVEPKASSRLADRLPSFDVLFVPGLIVALCVALTIASPYFLNSRNFGQILMQGAVLGIVAVGATFVIIGGDLDLSVGYNVALSGVTTAMIASDTGSWQMGVVAGLGAGLALGLVNGFLTTVLNVPSFVATLGTGTIAGGLALYMTGGSTISGLPDGFGDLATTEILGLQTMVWFMLLLFVLGGILLHRTSFGVKVFSTGGNRQAAFLSGSRSTASASRTSRSPGSAAASPGSCSPRASRPASPASARASRCSRPPPSSWVAPASWVAAAPWRARSPA